MAAAMAASELALASGSTRLRFGAGGSAAGTRLAAFSETVPALGSKW